MESKKIKILVVPSDYSGVGYFRSIWPHTYIQEKYGDEFDIDIVYSKDFPKNDLVGFFKNYDIVSYHKQFDKEGKIINLLKFLNIPTVVDIDDYFVLGMDHPLHISSQNEKWAETTVFHLRNSNYVTTTTPIFAKTLSKYNGDITVIPNAINPESKQFKQTKQKSDRIRFGLVCGSTHLNDIKLMSGISTLPKEIMDKVQYCLCGFDTNGKVTLWDKRTGKKEVRPIKPNESVWAKYEDFLTNGYKNVSPEHKEWLLKYLPSDDPFENDCYRRFYTKNINEYAKHYENVDVLLAPLKENDFNKMKSQLKAEECAFTNTAIIASEFGPYTIDLVPYIEKGGIINPKGNALLIDPSKNHKQWAKTITYVVNNPECIEIISKNLSNDLCEKYSIENVTKDRVELYRRIFTEKNGD